MSTTHAVPSAHAQPVDSSDEWLTAVVRPAGSFGQDTSRLRGLLDPLSACASIVVVGSARAPRRLRPAGAS